MLVTSAEAFRREAVHNIIVGQGIGHSFEAELRASGYDVRTIPPIAGSLANVLSFRRLVRRLGVDVIHIHTEGNYLRTVLAAKWSIGRRGVVVRTVHNVFEAKGRWLASRFIQALVGDRFISALIAPSPEVAFNERKLFRNAQVIFNWVDDLFFGISEQRQALPDRTDNVPIAVIVGNCSPIKHHELALKAVLSSNHQLIHVGNESGASDDELALLESLEKSDRLIGRGVNSPNSALLVADYFAMSSRHEGMPVALAEALTAGVPALVNDAPGLRWAGGMDGVSVLPDEEGAWCRAIANWRNGGTPPAAPTIDFSAARGAREYAQVYRLAISNRRLGWRLFSKETSGAGMA